MKNKTTKILASLALVFAGAFGLLVTVPTYADIDPFCSTTSEAEVGSTAWKAMGCDSESGTAAKDDLSNAIVNILKGVIGVAGLIAVVAIIIGATNYMTSSGDAAKLKRAKDTIIYALVGLIIAALAFGLVNMVAGWINNSNTEPQTVETSQS